MSDSRAVQCSAVQCSHVNVELTGNWTAQGTFPAKSSSHQKANWRPHWTRVSFQNNRR